MTLYTLDAPDDLSTPTLLAAFDGWVDSGSAATTAAARLAEGGDVIATFDGEQLLDYRARRPTLQITSGRLTELTWPTIAMRRSRIEGRDLLVLSGPEPDFRWREFSQAVIGLAHQLGAKEWISLGSIPAAVPHTRGVRIMGTESTSGLLHEEIQAGPEGLLRVPAAALSVLEMEIAKAGIPALGYFAQVPHYVTGPYPPAALALLRTVGRHLGISIPAPVIEVEARQLRVRLDGAAAADEGTKSYVVRLEAMVDEERLPAGDDLISEIERFLHDGGMGGGQGGSGGPGGNRPN